MPATSCLRPLFAAGLAGALLVSATAQAQQADLTVKATVVGECTLSGGTLDFGTYMSGQDSSRNRRAEIGVDCPPGLDITVMLGEGGNPGPGDFRNLTDGEHLLRYQLYRDAARTQVWSTGANGKRIDPTAGDSETHTVYGHIPPRQAVDPGNYSDTVLITLAIHG